MKPKEKARQLVNHFIIEIDYDSVSNAAWKNPMDEKENIRTMKDAKRYALKVVEEIIDERFSFRKMANAYNNERIKFWQEVRNEITKFQPE